MEQLRWELTPLEKAQLAAREDCRIGGLKLLEDLQRLKGLEIEQERAWWEEVCWRCDIPPKFRPNLLASSDIGEVWVRGKVAALDSALNCERENPAV